MEGPGYAWTSVTTLLCPTTRPEHAQSISLSSCRRTAVLQDPVPRLDFNKNGKVDYDEIPASAAKTIFKDIGVCVLAKKTEWASGGAVDKLCADPDAAKHGDICKQECAVPAGFMGCVGAAEVTGGGTMFDWCMGQYQNWVVREQVDWKTGQPKAR